MVFKIIYLSILVVSVTINENYHITILVHKQEKKHINMVLQLDVILNGRSKNYVW